MLNVESNSLDHVHTHHCIRAERLIIIIVNYCIVKKLFHPHLKFRMSVSLSNIQRVFFSCMYRILHTNILSICMYSYILESNLGIVVLFKSIIIIYISINTIHSNYLYYDCNNDIGKLDMNESLRG